MFARFTRLPLRRCLHTASTTGRAAKPFGRAAAVAIGASAATATYMTWRLTREGNSIALDSAASSNDSQALDSPTKSRPLKTARPTPAPSEASSSKLPKSESESASSTPLDGFVPDPAEPKDDGSVASEETDAEGDGETPASGSGGSGGAFNPETGEINWDCPCLGGMAHGPCGPEFREAFSCFVFSEDEPKGINCVDKFQAMQTCFRAHPEVYADEIMNDDDDDEPASADGSDVPPPTQSEEKIVTESSPEVDTEGKAHLDGVHVARDS